MGKISNSVNRYLSDNRRFADLFNGVYFNGHPVIRAEDLSETSEVYYGITRATAQTGRTGRQEKGKRHPDCRERTRDICKRLKTGETFRILALENQQMIDYTMPFRCMQYDVMEYAKQIDTIKNRNRQDKLLMTSAEKICGVKKTDRITPIYTICLYHGLEVWDGPRTLQDMMEFEGTQDSFRKIFKDYPMHLYCVNESRDLQVFHTEIGILFQALQYRKDRVGLRDLILQDDRYWHMDVDTLETMSVMLNLPSIWKEREKYMEKNEEKEEYNMCQAIREWAEEERSIGFTEGRQIIVKNMLMRGMADADIMAIAECNQNFIDEIRVNL